MYTPIRITVINSVDQSLYSYLKKVWAFRSLVVTLAIRDLKVKYAQTALGIFWTVLQPLTGLTIFTVFFSKLIKVDTNGIPYALFAFSGMISWFFFSQIIQSAGLSLLESQHLIKRIYFPRLILLVTKILVALAEFCVSVVLLFLLMLTMGIFFTWPVLFFPFLVIFNIAVAFSVAIWLSALTIKYRDFHHIIPYLVNFGIWLTPVFYPETLIPYRFRLFLFLNPMAAVVKAYRWSLIGGPLPDAGYWLSVIPVLFLLVTGLNYFKKTENEISDYI